MTIAVDLGRKATKQTNKQTKQYMSLCLCDLIFMSQSTIFQLCRDGSSWVEVNKDKCVLLKDKTQ